MLKNSLRAIAVMHVKINDGNSPDSRTLQCMHGADRNVVEQAETHRLFRLAMVAGWPHDTKCPECLVIKNLVNRKTQATTTAQRSVD